ncbi:MAG: glycosyltransferase family A protein [Syntrophobacteraceae bacterium]|jgi:glycosyltransferase involved in cell wall biosynthesis
MGESPEPCEVEKHILLSIVVISRNEEDNISRCIESVLQDTSEIHSREIILVDSSSEDQTVRIAMSYPIKIFQLQPSSSMSPALGRSVGTRLAKGEYIFFIDGDMELKPGWLESALNRISQDDMIAGISGRVRDLYIESNEITKEVKDRTHVGNKEGMSRGFGGCALYRRSALDRAGGFNAYIRIEEELDLALRIRNKGYYLWKLPLDMANHYTPHRGRFFEIKNTIRLAQCTGIGQVFRSAYENNCLWLCTRHAFRTFDFYVYIIGSAIMLSFGYYNKAYFDLWLAVTILCFVLLAIKKGSIGEAFSSLVEKICLGLTFPRDFLKRTRQPWDVNHNFTQMK